MYFPAYARSKPTASPALLLFIINVWNAIDSQQFRIGNLARGWSGKIDLGISVPSLGASHSRLPHSYTRIPSFYRLYWPCKHNERS